MYPFAYMLLPFLLSVGCVSFIAAWTARSAHLGYIGLQIAFSFFLTVFQEYAIPQGRLGEHAHIDFVHKFAAPVIMTPGRDRVSGILLALMVMWAIFHRFHSERSTKKMQRGLAQLLRIVAELLPLFGKGDSERVAELREEAEAAVVEVRGLAEAISYELDQHVERDLEMSETIQNAISSAERRLLQAAAQSQHREDGPSLLPSAGTLYEEMAEGLRTIAAMLEKQSAEIENSGPHPRIFRLRTVGLHYTNPSGPLLKRTRCCAGSVWRLKRA